MQRHRTPKPPTRGDLITDLLDTIEASRNATTQRSQSFPTLASQAWAQHRRLVARALVTMSALSPAASVRSHANLQPCDKPNSAEVFDALRSPIDTKGHTIRMDQVNATVLELLCSVVVEPFALPPRARPANIQPPS